MRVVGVIGTGNMGAALVRGWLRSPEPGMRLLVWDKVGPQYVFLGFVALDLLVRLPLLLGMPETLRTAIAGETSP